MRLLDLFCGAGGAAMGYHRAGFDEIIGVDIAAQPRYPFTFVQADALEYVAEHGGEFDAIHASPPCQGYSIMHNLPSLTLSPGLINDSGQISKSLPLRLDINMPSDTAVPARGLLAVSARVFRCSS